VDHPGLPRPAPRSWLKLPRRTIRLRLTLLYGTLFLGSGAILLTITYLLLDRATSNDLSIINHSARRAGGLTIHPLTIQALRGQAVLRALRGQAVLQHAADLHDLRIWSAIALAIMAVISIALGWLVAGRVLDPLRAMTATARQISERNLHERLAIDGPHDELKELADTIDGLLGRLQIAFDAQRRFVANASHELRTPLTLERALLEASLSDSAATLQSVRSTQERLLGIGEQQERLLEALLTLASSQRGIDHREPIDLSAVTDTVLLTLRSDAERLGLRLQTRTAPAPTGGDPRLVERLVANVLDNAVDHNIPDGRVEVVTGTKAGRAFLSVANSGPVISPEQVNRLFEPFQRLGTDRTRHTNDHHGIGLSIVRAIADAHDATLTTRPQPQGGLQIEITFPPTEHAATRPRSRPPHPIPN
jgi:signal transduction histidine kinase